ncbi:MAG: tagaturonate epimerase family protein [Pirellulales bacterium]
MNDANGVSAGVGRCQTLGLAPSFGFGDRTGLATPGHVAAMQAAGGPIQPIFPQQSIREMTRTRRSPVDVMSDAWRGIRQAGWHGAVGADADHLKTPADVDVTAAAGFTFFTIDPSGDVDPQADDYRADELAQRYQQVRAVAPWTETYGGRTVRLSTGSVIEMTPEVCQRAAVKYGRAVAAAIDMAKHIDSVQQQAGRDYEIELSVDETPQPTTLAEHYIIADQCLSGGMKLISLAPRFVGEFEKGVDFKGDLAAFDQSLRDHAEIARSLGPYKLSLHSGSDKLSIYGLLAQATAGCYHVKTAGTSYLEALRVVVRHQPQLFRELVEFARGRYDTDKATYHVSAQLPDAPPPGEISDLRQLEQVYLGLWDHVPAGQGFTDPGRQILHCTFGSVLTDPHWGSVVHQLLRDHADTYQQVLCDHFVRHLRALQPSR